MSRISPARQAGLDIDALERIMGDFFAEQLTGSVTVTLDGKVLRVTIPPGETQGVHLLAAYVPEQGVVLMQVEGFSRRFGAIEIREGAKHGAEVSRN